MKKTVKLSAALIAAILLIALALSFAVQVNQVAFADGEEQEQTVGAAVDAAPVDNSLEIELEKTKQVKGWVAGILIAAAAVAGAVIMGCVVIKAVESTARQPEAEGKIRTTMMLGLVFVETVVIYALIVAILVIFVL